MSSVENGGVSDAVRTVSPDPELFNRATVVRYVGVPRFIRRDWLAAEIADRLDDPSIRVVLLTGEPGSGKSSLVAQLAADHPRWPVYFLRRDQRAALEDASAKSFLLRIGLQLAAARPELFSTEQVRLVVEQRVGEIEQGGSAVAAEVRRILASPFHLAVIQIQQTVVGHAHGEAVGLRVGELVSDPRLLGVEDLAAMALVNPAQALARLHPDERIDVLIDALDERPEGPGEMTLLEWLARVTLPPNVRVIATSRPDEPRLAALADQHGPALARVSIHSEDPRVQADLRQYAGQLVDAPPIRRALADADRDPYEFLVDLVAHADGNIGYLDAIDRALAHDGEKPGGLIVVPDLVSLTRLPSSLRELHAFFLRGIRTGPGAQLIHVEDPATGASGLVEAWTALYYPLLELLCVAREPLNLDQLGGLADTHVRAGDLAVAVQRLRHLLDLTVDGYRLYHGTVAEFALADATRNDPATAELYVDGTAAHRRLALRVAADGDETWRDDPQRPDVTARRNYARHYYVDHLYEGKAWDRLFLTLDEQRYGRQKVAWDLSTSAYCADLDLGRRASSREDLTTDDAIGLLPALWRYSFLRVALASHADSYPADGYIALALIGQSEQAARLATLIASAKRRTSILVSVASAVSEAGDHATANAFLEDAAISASEVKDAAERAGATAEVLAACHALTRSGGTPSQPALETLERVLDGLGGSATADTWLELARVYLECDNFRPALDVAKRLQDLAHALPSGDVQDSALAALALLYTDFGEGDISARCFAAMQADVWSMLRVARALAGRSDLDDQVGLFISRVRALYNATASAPPEESCSALVQVAEILSAMGEREGAAVVRGDATDLFIAENLSAQVALELSASLSAAREDERFERVVAHLREVGLANIAEEKPGHGFSFSITSIDMAQTLAQLGATDAALEVARALEVASRGETLGVIAQALVRAGCYDQALALADEISGIGPGLTAKIVSEDDPLGQLPPDVRVRCLAAIALAEAGEMARSLEITQGLTSKSARGHTLAAMAKAAARAGAAELAAEWLAESQALLRLAAARNGRWNALETCLRVMLAARAWQAAERFIEQEQNLSRETLLNALHSAGERERVASIVQQLPGDWGARWRVKLALEDSEGSRANALAQAEQACREIADDRERTQSLLDISREMARDDPRHALDLILEAWRTYNGLSEASLWPEIFSQFVLIGLAEKALEYARQIPEGDEFGAVVALCLINARAMETGARIDHVVVLEEAAAVARRVSFPPVRADAMGRVAVEFAKLGMLDRAMQDDPEASAWINRDRRRRLGGYLAATGRPDEALELVGTSFGGDSGDIELAHAIIDALLAEGDVDRARSLAESLEPTKERAAAWRRIAERLLADGHRDEAAALAASAFESLVAEPGWSFGKQDTLEAAARSVVHTTGPDALIGRVRGLWRDATDRDVLAVQLALASPLAASRPEIAVDIAASFGWVDEFLDSIQP